MTTNAKDAILDLERRRCEAISAADEAALRAVLSDDYIHVHATGHIDRIDTYLKVVTEHPRHTERGEITLRQYGDVAVLVGDQVNTRDSQKTAVVVTQVAVRQGDQWRFVTTQVARKAQH